MTPNEYQEAALAKEADQVAIRERVYNQGTTATRLENGFRGLTNEVGEIADVLKGWLEYGKPLNITGLLEECGDVLWRTCQILRAVGFTLEQAMEANLAKLKVRYKERCTDAEAANRDTTAEIQALKQAMNPYCGPFNQAPVLPCGPCNGTGTVSNTQQVCQSCAGTGAYNPSR